MLARTRNQVQVARQKRAAIEGVGNEPKRSRAFGQDVTNKQSSNILPPKAVAKPGAKKNFKNGPPVAPKRAPQFSVAVDENAQPQAPVRKSRASASTRQGPTDGPAPIAKIDFAISSSSEDVSATSAMSVSQLASVLGAAGLRSASSVSPPSFDAGSDSSAKSDTVSNSDSGTVQESELEPVPEEEMYDYDKDVCDDPLCVPVYAKDIFKYYLHREAAFQVADYMRGGLQPNMNEEMRTIVIDWMVEIQESFEANHETLYQAVKMFDLYMSLAPPVEKDSVQLVAATALFISAKFDERLPPALDDFLYVCDDAYSRETFLRQEMQILKLLNFDIGWPLSYRYLRRFGKLTNLEMCDLTLARYILETSLLHFEFAQESESKLAAAAHYLALRLRDRDAGTNLNKDVWTPLHCRASGYNVSELSELMGKLNGRLHEMAQKSCKTTTIRTKYSHDVFFEVSKILPLNSFAVRM